VRANRALDIATCVFVAPLVLLLGLAITLD
jgi:hypothetical protein